MKQPDYFNVYPVPDAIMNNVIKKVEFADTVAPHFQSGNWDLLVDMYKHMKMLHDGECGEFGSNFFNNTKFHVADSFWRWIVPLMQSIEDSQETPEEESEEEPEEIYMSVRLDELFSDEPVIDQCEKDVKRPSEVLTEEQIEHLRSVFSLRRNKDCPQVGPVLYTEAPEDMPGLVCVTYIRTYTGEYRDGTHGSKYALYQYLPQTGDHVPLDSGDKTYDNTFYRLMCKWRCQITTRNDSSNKVFVGLYEQQNGVIYDVTPLLFDLPVSRMPVATEEKPAQSITHEALIEERSGEALIEELIEHLRHVFSQNLDKSNSQTGPVLYVGQTSEHTPGLGYMIYIRRCELGNDVEYDLCRCETETHEHAVCDRGYRRYDSVLERLVCTGKYLMKTYGFNIIGSNKTFVGLYEQQDGVIYDVTSLLLDQPANKIPIATEEKPASKEAASEDRCKNSCLDSEAKETEENKPVTRKELFNILQTFGLTEKTQ